MVVLRLPDQQRSSDVLPRGAVILTNLFPPPPPPTCPPAHPSSRSGLQPSDRPGAQNKKMNKKKSQPPRFPLTGTNRKPASSLRKEAGGPRFRNRARGENAPG